MRRASSASFTLATNAPKSVQGPMKRSAKARQNPRLAQQPVGLGRAVVAFENIAKGILEKAIDLHTGHVPQIRAAPLHIANEPPIKFVFPFLHDLLPFEKKPIVLSARAQAANHAEAQPAVTRTVKPPITPCGPAALPSPVIPYAPCLVPRHTVRLHPAAVLPPYRPAAVQSPLMPYAPPRRSPALHHAEPPAEPPPAMPDHRDRGEDSGPFPGDGTARPAARRGPFTQKDGRKRFETLYDESI